MIPELEIKFELPLPIGPEGWVAVDLEMFNMDKRKMHRHTTGQFASLQICADGKTVYFIDDEAQVAEAMARIHPLATLVMHNALFDLNQLQRWIPEALKERVNLWDTLLMEQVIYGGFYSDFGLEDLARRYLNLRMDKNIRNQFNGETQLSTQMIQYGALDAQVTWLISKKQFSVVRPEDMFIYNSIEKPCIYSVLNFKGFRIDVTGWKELALQHRTQADQIKTEFAFNLNSHPQTLKYLQAHGLPNITATNEKVLNAHRKNPAVSRLLEFRRLEKLAGTYGENFLDDYLEGEYAYFPIRIIGAETGRFSASGIQQVPVRDTNEFRKLFIASPGNDLIIADYSAQEPRVTAWESQDKNLIALLKAGGDVHLEVARKIYRDPTIQKGDRKRKEAKSINLGLTYGLTAKGLLLRLNEDLSNGERYTLEDCEKLIADYFRAFPGVQAWIENERHFASQHSYVETASGRRIWVNLYAWQWPNNSINSPNQGGAADITKRALNRLRNDCEWCGLPYPVVATVHDEIILDTPHNLTPVYQEMLEKAMVEEAQRIYEGIPFEVEIAVGPTWASKK